MKLPTTPDRANDNGKPEDHLAVATVALHAAIKGLDAPVELLASKIEALPVSSSTDIISALVVSGTRSTGAET